MNDIMGLFEHLKFVGNMKIENALQKAEDPNQVFNYSYTKQLEQLQQLRQGLVTIVQNEKHIEMLEAQVEAQMNRLQQQAAQAMQQGREDLARLALQRKEALVAQVDAYKQQLEQLSAQHQKIELLVGQAEQRISTFKTQKEMVEAQEIYHPLAWTPQEAYRFLKEVPVFEDSGLVVKVPDWWKSNRPPRPQDSRRRARPSQASPSPGTPP